MMNGTKHYNITYEVWVKIPEFTNYYVSNMGRVKRIYKNGKERILRQHLCHNGYYRVKLCNNTIRKNYRVNRLVLQVFTGLTNEVSHHINNIRTDNHIWNLEWITSKQNNQPENRKQKVSD